MDIEGQRTEMLEENSSINWFPQHIKRGRFEKTVQSAPDWNLSRDRFWATAMPVWKAVDKEGTEHIKVVGSYAELKELSGIELDDYHRPWIDDVTFTIDGLKYTRIEKVLDCWFESGSMPFAQFHYPFENVDTFENSYPGDFISEYVGQVRAWFYYLHAVNVGLFEKNAFKNVIVTGSVMGSDGKKLSKSLGNYTDPNEVMDLYGADSLRFALLSSPVLSGEDVTLKDKEIGDISRKLAMVWNMYDFFTLYADVDGWEWNPPAMGVLEDPSEFCTNSLDKWIISRVHQLITEIDSAMQTYDVPQATKGILPFIDDASNWYVRRSRKRFWKSDDAADKDMAYRTLHYVLVQLARAMAPFTPFLSEQMYINLTGKESVHLEDWPEVGHVDELLLDQMESTRNYIVSGLAIRAKKGIKVRQPLRAVVIGQASPVGVEFEEIIKEELNVKNVEYRKKTEGEESVELDTTLSKALKEEGMIREVIRFVQNARKDARLEVDDRIHLSLSTESAELTSAIKNFAEVLQEETLATEVTNELQESLYETTITVDSNNLTIRLNKT
jgi:isoleucyl-tRNA synthetase